MNPLLRWFRFNLVGVAGFLVQFLALALLLRCIRGHALLLSALATEVAILQNFILHLRFTWPEPSRRAAVFFRFLRFQTSTGLVSLAGTFAVVRPLTHRHAVPLLQANLAAVVLCSLANFLLANCWSFRAERPGTQHRTSPGTPIRAIARHRPRMFP